MLKNQQGWRAYFDVSRSGILFSFSGLVIGLPALFIWIYAADYLARQVPDYSMQALSWVDITIIWARIWFLFPIVSAVVVRVLRLPSHYGPWLVVHNWTILLLIHIPTFFYLLAMLGLIGIETVSVFVLMYLGLRLLVHWRVAVAALGISPGLAVAAAGIPMAVDWILIQLLL